MLESDDKPTVYVETTIPSYLTAWPSRDLRRASHQQVTREWWRTAADRYDLFVSQPVLDECGRGDADAARDRLAALAGIPSLAVSAAAQRLSAEYVRLLKIPPKAAVDALHVAYASVFEVDYLVTWNMRHLASSLTMRRLTEYNVGNGWHTPLILTPEALDLAWQFDREELP